MLEGMGAAANSTGTVTITDSRGSAVTWTKATVSTNGSSDQLMYYSLQDNVIFMLIGADSAAMEKFLAAWAVGHLPFWG